MRTGSLTDSTKEAVECEVAVKRDDMLQDGGSPQEGEETTCYRKQYDH